MQVYFLGQWQLSADCSDVTSGTPADVEESVGLSEASPLLSATDLKNVSATESSYQAVRTFTPAPAPSHLLHNRVLFENDPHDRCMSEGGM